MLEKYMELKKGGRGEIIEKKSRFIACVEKVETEEEAFALIEKVKKKNYDARHNCFAFSIGSEQPILRFSDDGEPQGTAGKPILEVIVGSNIKNICIVVTRYFGGTLLGTGGLARAYSEAAKIGISTCEIVEKQLGVTMNIKIGYTEVGKVQYILKSKDINIIQSIFEEQVDLIVLVPIEQRIQVKELIIEATCGNVHIKESDELYFEI